MVIRGEIRWQYNFSGSDLTDVIGQPTISSITPSSTTEANLPLAGVVIAGAGFTPSTTVTMIGASGTSVVVPTVAYNSATQLTVTLPAGLGGVNEDPFDVKVENPVSGQGDNLFSVDDNPVFATAAGTIGTIVDTGRAAPAYTLSPVTATDPEGVTVTYSLVSPGPAVSPGLSFDTTNAAITGTASAVPSDTTTTFRVRATAGAQTSDRDFSITVKAPVQQYLTTAGAGTYSITHTGNIKLLVVAGGGSGSTGGHSGGGGAGGMVDHPAYAATPQTYNYYIGAGGDYTAPVGQPAGVVAASGNTTAQVGQNSNWGTATGDLVSTASVLAAIGGGIGSNAPASDGGSGGGKDHGNGPGGSGEQTNSPLISPDSKSHGYGNNGGSAPYSGPAHPSGGGGGAGGVGNAGSGGSTGGNGGAGRSVSGTYGSGTNSGTFCGGGGGGTHQGGSGGSGGGSGAGNGVATGNTNRGNAAAVNSGSGGGSGNSGGSGVIGIAF